MIQVQFAPVHIHSEMLHCTSVRLAGQLDTCVMENHKLVDQPSQGAVKLVRNYPWVDNGITITIKNFTTTGPPNSLDTPKSLSNSLDMHIADNSLSVDCKFAAAPEKPLLVAHKPVACNRSGFGWYTSSSRPNDLTDKPDSKGAPSDASLRIIRRFNSTVDMSFVKRPNWVIDYEVLYAFPLKNRDEFNYSCPGTWCMGHSIPPGAPGKVYHVDWKSIKIKV